MITYVKSKEKLGINNYYISVFVFLSGQRKVIAGIIINMINIDIPWINNFVLTQLKNFSLLLPYFYSSFIKYKILYHSPGTNDSDILKYINSWGKPYFLRNCLDMKNINTYGKKDLCGHSKSIQLCNQNLKKININLK